MGLEDILKKRFSQHARFDVMRWLMEGHRGINKNEQMSLLSLLAYTAVETETPVEDLQGKLLGHFHVGRIEQIKGDDYEDAVTFMMEWKVADKNKPADAAA